MVRITKIHAELAADLLPRARDTADLTVIKACIRIRQGWLLGHRVDRADITLIEAFA